jgi:hypothetical protein
MNQDLAAVNGILHRRLRRAPMPCQSRVILGEMPMPIVRFICMLALLAGMSLCGLHLANAQASPEVQQACTPDAMRLCSEFIPDVAKITACMKAKHAQLSAACITAMRGGRPELRRVSRHEAETTHEARHHETRHYERRQPTRHEARRAREHCDKYTHLCN